MRIRSYGSTGHLVFAVHGGPGAAGSMAPVARGLADTFRVIEPFQNEDSVTVAEHIEDLHQVVLANANAMRPAIVGHSWGAMLTLAYAAAYPESTGPLVLICSGTFGIPARARFAANLNSRMDSKLRQRFEHLNEEFPDHNERFAAMGKLTLQLYSYDLEAAEWEAEMGDQSAGADIWDDMVRLQDAGVYPAAFAAIKSPVLMLHGDYDPHPAHEIRDSLMPYLPQLEYVEMENCGHYPWIEKSQSGTFFPMLKSWLGRQFG
jgi:pimeloyl-ACP methyl ester carboxylesterase